MASVNGFTGGSGGGGGGSTTNTARIFIVLKPLEERKISADYDHRAAAAEAGPGARRDALSAGVAGRARRRTVVGALYQFTMRGDNLQDLITYGPQMLRELRRVPEITDVNTDQQNNGLQSVVQYDRRTASRFGISPQLIDNTLYDAFGQRQVSTMYTTLNQYHVVMEAAPAISGRIRKSCADLRALAERAAGSAERFHPVTPHHRAAGGESPGTVSGGDNFLQSGAGVALGDAVDAIQEAAGRGRACLPLSTPPSPEPRRPIRIR